MIKRKVSTISDKEWDTIWFCISMGWITLTIKKVKNKLQYIINSKYKKI